MVIVAGVFAIAFGLLGLTRCGYQRIAERQSREKVEKAEKAVPRDLPESRPVSGFGKSPGPLAPDRQAAQ